MASEEKYINKRFSVKILNEELVVKGEISEEYVQRLANYVNEIGDEITRVYPRLPRRRLVGLTTINMADEFFKLKNEYMKKVKENRNLKEEKEKLVSEKDNLKIEKENLKKELDSLREDYEELTLLLEEVDG